MDIAIVGGGITGLTSGYKLAQLGHKVTIFEKESYLGGLAYGFRRPNWDWSLEYAYHHLFTGDESILNLLKELGLNDSIIIKRPVTATLFNDQMYPLDSASTLLSFPGLPLIDRLRTGVFIAGMKLLPYTSYLETHTAENLIRSFGGENGWKVIWEPLLLGKFEKYSTQIAASWYWARIKKRTPSLAYISGGFQTLIDKLEESITSKGGKIYKNTTIDTVTPDLKIENRFTIKIGRQNYQFDRVILTTPTPIAAKLVPSLPKKYLESPLKIPHLHAQVLILETEKPVLDSTYWLNITDRSYPFLAIVAHTNYMDKKHYGGHHITYIGNYLPENHRLLKQTKEQILKIFIPYILKLNPKLSTNFKIYNSYLASAPFAQPVHTTNYKNFIPALETPISGLYLRNMDAVFPWDRGTNFAVELGIEIASKIQKTVSGT